MSRIDYWHRLGCGRPPGEIRLGQPGAGPFCAEHVIGGALPVGRLLKNRWLIQLAVIGGLLGAALVQVDLGALGRSFSDARYEWLLLAAMIYVGSRLVHAVEWQITLSRVGRAPFLGLFGVLLIGTLVNCVVPASAGDVVKIQIVANRYRLPRAGLVAGRGAEAIVNAVLIVVFVLVSFVLPNSAFASPKLLWWLAGATVAALVGSVFVARMLPRSAPRAGALPLLPRRFRASVDRHWPRIHEGFEVIRRPRLLALALAFNLFGWIVDILISWAFGRAFNLDVPLAAYVSVTVAIGLITIFPITFGNVGTFELAVVSALALYEVPADAALAFAVGTHLFSTLFNIALGVVAMLLMRMRPGDVFRLRHPSPGTNLVAEPSDPAG